MARFMDFHEDLQLPADAIAQLAEDARTPGPISWPCARSSFTTTPKARCTACWTGQMQKPSARTTPRGSARPAFDQVDSLS